MNSQNLRYKLDDKKKINLLFLNLNLNIGGIETLILNIAKRLDKNKYVPEVCVLEKNGALEAEFIKNGISVNILEKKTGFDKFLALRVASFLKQKKINILHTHNHSVWLYGGLAAKIANIPLIHTEHTSPHYNLKRWKKIERYLSYITDRITTVSNSVARFMIEQEFISANKIKVIHNGIEYSTFQKEIDKAAKRKELNVMDNSLVVGNVARFFPNKDQACLLQAFRIVVDKIPQAVLLIAGDGPLKNELLQLTEQLKLTEKVKFLGNRRDIPELLQIFDIFALSSIKEGLPITILEAMAAGLAVVATNVDGNPEVVEDRVTGLLVSPKNPKLLAEAIIELLTHSEKRKMMGSLGQKKVTQEFSFAKMINSYDTLYSEVLSKRRRWTKNI